MSGWSRGIPSLDSRKFRRASSRQRSIETFIKDCIVLNGDDLSVENIRNQLYIGADQQGPANGMTPLTIELTIVSAAIS